MRAAYCLRHLVGESGRFRSDRMIPGYEPFALDARTKDAPSHLGIKVVIGEHVYDYEIGFERNAFTFERLKRWEDSEHETTLFKRERQNVQGSWNENEHFSLLSQDFRPNALLLSIADQLTPALAKNIAIGIWKLLSRFSPTYPQSSALPHPRSVAMRADKNPAFKTWLLAQLESADVGVVDMQIKKETYDVDIGDNSNEEVAQVADYELALTHRGADNDSVIPYGRESLGTQRFVEFAPVLFDLSHQAIMPQVFFVDEIGESLHPLLLQGMLRHFNGSIPMSQVSGQLIFATHDTSLIDAEAKNAILRRDQIYLTEKDASGAARLYSVAEFKERNNLNLRRRYLQGRYGALPSVGAFVE
jgi:uncharacterized protein